MVVHGSKAFFVVNKTTQVFHNNPMSEFEEQAVVKKVEDASEDVNLVEVITSGGNPRGIPSAVFIENVEQFLQGHSIESMLGALNELYSKYKYMETSFEKSKGVYKSKIPEIEQTLEIISMLMKKRDEGEEMVTHYPLCDTLYAEAKVDTSDSKICLWVGASTMVEYSYEEGKELLETQVEQTKIKIDEINEDLAHLRTNSITVEVNMARLFNANVKAKKLKESS